MTTFTYGIAREVIASDIYARRFEDFSNAIVGIVEGDTKILRTSASWDQGRDGRGKGSTGIIYTCCSLKDEVDEKATADIKRLTANIKVPAKIYFCSSQTLSEHHCDHIEAHLRKLLPAQTEITVFGALQLAELATKYPEIALKHYPSEIDDCLHALRDDIGNADAEIPGLRLALISSCHEDSAAIRKGIYRSGLISVSSDKKVRSLGVYARDLGALLRLSRNIPEEVVKEHIKILANDGVLAQNNGQYQITPKGLQEHDGQTSTAARELLSGKNLIRVAIENSLGQKLTEEHYSLIWQILEEKITSYFYYRGEYMVREVCALTGVDYVSSVAFHDNTMPGFKYIDDLSDSVAETSSLESQRAEIRTAIKDLFSDREGEAANWLIKICCAYIAACSLGLEATCGQALGRVISKMTLVFDTDVLLSLLCEGEPYHQSVNAIMQRWSRLGGKLLYAEPVLREVAYHAWIAENDYREVKKWLPGSPEDRLRLVENAFVRGFAELLAHKKATLNQWTSYINRFCGTKEYDWSKIAGELSSEYGLGELPPRSADEVSLEMQVKNHLSIHANKYFSGIGLHNALDKAKRDAALYASMVRYLRALRKSDPGAGCLLVSSAKRLADVEAVFSQSGERHIVVSISMILYLLSIMPQVSLGIEALKAFIFDERKLRFSSGLERVLLRVVRESEQMSIPWARRGTLIRAVREKLIDNAKKSGEQVHSEKDISRIEHIALKADNRASTVEVLSQALDKIAATTEGEKERAVLKKRVSELEEEVARLRRHK